MWSQISFSYKKKNKTSLLDALVLRWNCCWAEQAHNKGIHPWHLLMATIKFSYVCYSFECKMAENDPYTQNFSQLPLCLVLEMNSSHISRCSATRGRQTQLKRNNVGRGNADPAPSPRLLIKTKAGLPSELVWSLVYISVYLSFLIWSCSLDFKVAWLCCRSFVFHWQQFTADECYTSC